MVLGGGASGVISQEHSLLNQVGVPHEDTGAPLPLPSRGGTESRRLTVYEPGNLRQTLNLRAPRPQSSASRAVRRKSLCSVTAARGLRPSRVTGTRTHTANLQGLRAPCILPDPRARSDYLSICVPLPSQTPSPRERTEPRGPAAPTRPGGPWCLGKE